MSSCKINICLELKRCDENKTGVTGVNRFLSYYIAAASLSGVSKTPTRGRGRGRDRGRGLFFLIMFFFL